jgi:hypothetical protein
MEKRFKSILLLNDLAAHDKEVVRSIVLLLLGEKAGMRAVI